jgi:hypothetical protein
VVAFYEGWRENSRGLYHIIRYKCDLDETYWDNVGKCSGGEGGIRTREKLAPLRDFQSRPFVHSGTSPSLNRNRFRAGARTGAGNYIQVPLSLSIAGISQLQQAANGLEPSAVELRVGAPAFDYNGVGLSTFGERVNPRRSMVPQPF